jgi:hypothetical protein
MDSSNFTVTWPAEGKVLVYKNMIYGRFASNTKPVQT